MAVDVITCRRTEKNRGAADVSRLAPTFGGNSLQDLPVARLVALQGRRVVREDVTRRDRVHVDPAFRPFVGQRLGELCDSTLRGSVRRNVNASLKRQQRSDVQDLARLVTLNPLAPRKLAQLAQALQLNLQD